MKKETDAVLTLQGEVDKLDEAIKSTRAHLTALSPVPPNTLLLISQLQTAQTNMIAKIEKLYTTLNVDQIFPQLDGLPVEFVRVLIAARDLKMNVRRRAVANFMEWDRLDQAAGGRGAALGESTLITSSFVDSQSRV